MAQLCFLLAMACLLRRLAGRQVVRIVALSPLDSSQPFGFGMHEAYRMMAAHINQNSAILPNHTIEIVAVNSECDASVAETKVHTLLLTGSVDVINISRPPFGYDFLPRTLIDGNFVGIIGPGCSAAVRTVVGVLGIARVPMISPSATSNALSDRGQYPYFWRTSAPDQPQAMAEVAAALGFKQVALFLGDGGEGWLATAEVVLLSWLVLRVSSELPIMSIVLPLLLMSASFGLCIAPSLRQTRVSTISGSDTLLAESLTQTIPGQPQHKDTCTSNSNC
eukprot:TRINITY_DN8136_c0_g1_i3.p1 TRINITY_DN8136_c0_g1~~TRINITY_DN8136_c0_g1_i3.p1  ORF type:complete len:279 (-),score=28.07 TRINITY_DN8136_c0_g1_i3:83-919(-)